MKRVSFESKERSLDHFCKLLLEKRGKAILPKIVKAYLDGRVAISSGSFSFVYTTTPTVVVPHVVGDYLVIGTDMFDVYYIIPDGDINSDYIRLSKSYDKYVNNYDIIKV